MRRHVTSSPPRSGTSSPTCWGGFTAGLKAVIAAMGSIRPRHARSKCTTIQFPTIWGRFERDASATFAFPPSSNELAGDGGISTTPLPEGGLHSTAPSPPNMWDEVNRPPSDSPPSHSPLLTMGIHDDGCRDTYPTDGHREKGAHTISRSELDSLFQSVGATPQRDEPSGGTLSSPTPLCDIRRLGTKSPQKVRHVFTHHTPDCRAVGQSPSQYGSGRDYANHRPIVARLIQQYWLQRSGTTLAEEEYRLLYHTISTSFSPTPAPIDQAYILAFWQGIGADAPPPRLPELKAWVSICLAHCMDHLSSFDPLTIRALMIALKRLGSTSNRRSPRDDTILC